MKIKIKNENNIIKSVHIYQVSDNIIGMRIWLHEKWGCKLMPSNVSVYKDDNHIDTFMVENTEGCQDSFDIITTSKEHLPSGFFTGSCNRWEINAIFTDADILFPYSHKEWEV